MLSRLLTAIRHAIDRSSVGVGLPATPAARVLFALPALALGLYWGRIFIHRLDWPSDTAKWLTLLPCVVFLLVLARGQREPLGLLLTPRQGWSPWLRYTAVAGVLVALAGIPVGLALYFGGAIDMEPPYESISLRGFFFLFYDSVLQTPVFEELGARLICLAGLVPLLGRRGAFVASAVLFGLWHWYNPGATNLIAGFAFGWAYLASGSLVVPILWHALGNLFVLIVNVVQCWSTPVS